MEINIIVGVLLAIIFLAVILKSVRRKKLKEKKWRNFKRVDEVDGKSSVCIYSENKKSGKRTACHTDSQQLALEKIRMEAVK